MSDHENEKRLDDEHSSHDAIPTDGESEINLRTFHENKAGRLVVSPECVLSVPIIVCIVLIPNSERLVSSLVKPLHRASNSRRMEQKFFGHSPPTRLTTPKTGAPDARIYICSSSP